MADIYSGLTRLRLEPVQAASGPSQLDPLFQARVPAVSLPPSIAMHAKVQHAPAIVSLFDPAGRCHGRTRLDQTGIWQPVTFPAFPLGAGTYFVRLEGDSGTRVYRTQLLR
jgi:hypothetical protein